MNMLFFKTKHWLDFELPYLNILYDFLDYSFTV